MIKPKRFRSMSDDDCAKIIELYNNGIAVKTLASEHAVSVSLMYNLLRANAKMRPRGNRRGNVRSEKRKQIEQALRVGAKKSLAAIARATGVSREYARRVAELSGHTEFRTGKGTRKIYSVSSLRGEKAVRVQEFDQEGHLVSDRWA
jgi:hypothetical protein